jgi:hypothetical protein
MPQSAASHKTTSPKVRPKPGQWPRSGRWLHAGSRCNTDTSLRCRVRLSVPAQQGGPGLRSTEQQAGEGGPLHSCNDQSSFTCLSRYSVSLWELHSHNKQT